MFDRPLIELNIPDTDDWEDSLAARILLIVTGLLLYRLGFRVWATMMPDYWPSAVISLCLFGLGTQLLVLASTDPEHFDMEVWGPRISYAILGILLAIGLLTLHRNWIPKIGTDALLFSRASVDALLNGHNPYEMSMVGAVSGKMGPQYATPRIDGGIVHQLSYPAGAVLAFVPQYATIGPSPYGIRLTLFVLALACSAVVVDLLPPKLAIAGVAVFLVPRNLIAAAAGGIIWPLWMFPLLLGFRDWAGGRWTRAAFFVGLAAGTKQHAWFVLPFLAVWVWRASRGWRDFGRRAARLNAAGTAGFVLLNLPFLVWSPHHWLDGVLTPVSTKAPMVHQGVGLAAISTIGAVPLPSWWYTLTVLAATAVAATGYYLYWDAIKWTAWCIPPLLLFFNTRSLMSYFTTWTPLFVLAAVAAWHRLDLDTPALPTATPTRREVLADD